MLMIISPAKTLGLGRRHPHLLRTQHLHGGAAREVGEALLVRSARRRLPVRTRSEAVRVGVPPRFAAVVLDRRAEPAGRSAIFFILEGRGAAAQR